MPAVFGVVCFIAMIWSAVKYQIVSNRVVELMPPQFQDDLTSRYALAVYALYPSTPLPLQAEYVKSLGGGCIAMLFFFLCLASSGQALGSWLALGGFVMIAISTFQSWKTYRTNCNR